MDRRSVRWTLAAVLAGAAAVNVYLAVSAWVIWPAPLALLWIGFAVALLLPASEPAEAAVEIPMPRTARESLALAEHSNRAAAV
ncbi:hypothetical protein [Actinokineospora enzanensis]|uniref:hypothetical protein n=1 Tax=Actinokineospora enzanensis TaxID=155975 RepID=UPI00037E8F11|nr:hypothetical protein [Actinokineospora enzanensis]